MSARRCASCAARTAPEAGARIPANEPRLCSKRSPRLGAGRAPFVLLIDASGTMRRPERTTRSAAMACCYAVPSGGSSSRRGSAEARPAFPPDADDGGKEKRPPDSSRVTAEQHSMPLSSASLRTRSQPWLPQSVERSRGGPDPTRPLGLPSLKPTFAQLAMGHPSAMRYVRHKPAPPRQRAPWSATYPPHPPGRCAPSRRMSTFMAGGAVT